MSRENRYLLGIVSLLIIWETIYIKLFLRHAIEFIYSISDTCLKMFETYNINTQSNLGIFLILLSAVSGGFIISKLILSIVKIKKRKDYLFDNQIENYKNAKQIINKLHLSKKTIIVNSNKNIALVIGILKPKIVISSQIIDKLSKKELESVLLHESYHLNKKHTQITLLLETLKTGLFFIPIMNDFVKNFRFLMETEADKYTIKQQKESKYLKSALYKVPHSDLSFLPSFATTNKSKRLQEIDSKNTKQTFAISNILISIISIMGGIYLLASPINAMQNTKYEPNGCTNDNCIQRCLMQENMSIQKNYEL